MRVLCLLAAILAAVTLQVGATSTAQASSRHRMSFTPGERSRPAYHGWSRRRAGGERHGSRHVTRAAPRRSRGPVDEGGGAAVPGAGFKLENGVLTYPAPARFQPRNLKHP